MGMATIIIKRDDAPVYQTKLAGAGVQAIRGAADWRASCDCGWADKFGAEREAISVAQHHSSVQHEGKAFVLRTGSSA